MNRLLNCKQSRKIEYWIFLLCIVAVGVCYYGIRALAVYGLAVVTAILTDFVCLFLEKKSYKLADLANAGMALTMCMMFPATVPYSIVILSTIFAVAVGAHVFGYRKGYLFPPSAVGYLFALSCWKDEILHFPATGERLPLLHYQAELSSSMSSILLTEHEIHDTWTHILMGTVYSPMGTGCIVMLLVGMLVLLCQKQSSLWACLGYLLGISISSFFMSVSMYAVLVSCMVLFCMIFMVADPSVMPCKNIMAYIGAFVTGLLTCCLMAFSQIEYAPVVAVVLTVPLWQWLGKVEQRFLPEPMEEEEIPLENMFEDDTDDFEDEPEEIDFEDFEEDDDFEEDEDFEDDDFDEDDFDEEDFDDFEDLDDEPEDETDGT